MRCTQCDGTDLQPGFIEDGGEHSRGYSRWIEGPLKVGLFGGARRMGKQRRAIEAYCCTRCSHIELFVRRDD
ncbi:hypothetical protein GCM10010156_22780 [Planobispora rosea]|uniref:Uncharacterized protein n=1 Tax=Planobispora rosea TaxID=35762 RepID=A0A8J3RZ44_PLARO|nr:hypothetical protein [Planobispora rosea]GGS63288.1 hypothetical protein GCM10010156_22780 [Planobispora rosea]GIH84442.1 hypothetical protein Pro02_28500 [Planobispora rosea]